MEDYYEYLDSNGVTTLYKLIKDDTVALIDSYSVTINGITTTLDTHINNMDIHTPIADIENMVDTKIAGLVNSAPETLDTLKELSDALGSDPNFATTVANQIGNKANKDDVYTKEETNTLLEGKANSVHNHVVSDITDFPTIPTKVSELSNDSNFVTSTELHDYATKNDLNSKQDALSEEQLSNIDSIPNKANKSDLSTVATSGSYKDLLDKPVIPEGSDLSDYYNKGETDNLLNSKANTSDLAVVAKSGNYNDLNNTPTIPTKVSQLENDMGFGTGGDTSDCVHKTGNETINGIKTFNDTVVQKKDGIFKNDNIDITTTPSSNFFSHLFFADKNSVANAYMRYVQRTNGINEINLFVRDKDLNNYGVSVNTNNEFLPVLNNTYSLGSSDLKWKKIYSDDVVHTSGNETINGDKTFNNYVTVCGNFYNKNVQADFTQTPASNLYTQYRFVDKNNKTMGYIQHVQRHTGVNQLTFIVRDSNNTDHGFLVSTNKELLPAGNNTYSLGASGVKWANVYSTNDITDKVITYSVTNHNNTSSMTVSGGSDWDKGSTLFLYGNSHSNYPGAFDLTAKNTTNESKLIGFPNGTLQWGGKNIALDENLVHRSGNEYISGVKSFNNLMYIYDNMSNKNSQMDLFTTPANTLYAHYMFVDKNNEVCAYMQYGQQKSGTDFIGLFIHDKNRALHGIQVTTNNELIPLHNNTYNLGSSTNKWANVYATTFNGNLRGNADTATYSPTPATTDNSTRIATTAWVRNYVNSVGRSSISAKYSNATTLTAEGSSPSSAGSSIAAYYSNATTLTATKSSAIGSGSFPAVYSDYINIAPTVGTIYTGSQLFSTLNASASGSQSDKVYQTTAKATATFSGAFSSSAKYLCTTANAVRFRAYVSQGTSSAMGSPSVVDNSSARSIFIRVE